MLQQSDSCCYKGRSNRLKPVTGDKRCGRWTSEKCKKVQEKQICCLKKATLEEELAKITSEAPVELATVYCDGFTSHFCNLLDALGMSNSTCCTIGHFAHVPMENPIS